MLADFAITKPTVGGSSGTWGTELNAALDVLVAHPGIKVVADADAKAAYVPLLGQVLLQADTGKLYKCTNATGPVWVEVGITDGVLTSQGDILIQGASSPARLGIGTAGQILTVNAGATAPEWKTVGASPLTTKGDVYVYGSADARLPVGTNGQVLTADSAQALGVKWATGGGFNGIPETTFTTPTVAGFAASRAGTGTFANITMGVRMTAPGTTTNTNSLIYLVDSITEGTAGYRATARIRRHTPLVSWGMMGLILRNSADSKAVIYVIGKDTVTGFHRNTYSNDTTWASVTELAGWYELDFWIRVHDDLTNRKIFVSRYGDYWQQIYTEAHDTYVAPDQVGVLINPNFGSTVEAPNVQADTGMDVYSWQLESLSA